MELELQRCTLRPWRPEDVDAIVPHADDRAIWLNLRDRFPHPYTREDARRWVGSHDAGDPQFAIVVDGRACGAIGLLGGVDVHRRTAEIGFWLGRRYWGRGIVTEAVRAVTELAFSRYGFSRVYAMVYEWNPASARVLEKAGYRLEGRQRKNALKDGREIDTLLYAIIDTDLASASSREVDGA